MTHRIKTFLFDMDGVIYDSMPHHALAWTRAMQQFGLTMTEADAYATEGARGIDTIQQMVLQQQGRHISLEEAQRMYDLKTQFFHELPETKPFPSIHRLMQMIVAQGMSVGVVTGSGQRPLIERLLHDFGDVLSPEHITTAYDVKRGKPAPDPYLQGLQRAGQLSPEQGVVVENAPLGVRSGVAAGCFTVAVNSGPLPDEALLREGAHALYPSIDALANDFSALLQRVEAC